MYYEICKNDVTIAYLRVPTQDPMMILEWMKRKLVVSLTSSHQELEMIYPNQNCENNLMRNNPMNVIRVK